MIVCLTSEELREFLRTDADNYINSLSVADLQARGVKSHSEYKKLAVMSAREFSL